MWLRPHTLEASAGCGRVCSMTNSTPAGSRRSQAAKPHPLDPWAAFLSYLIPGLGQIYQGRVAKGLLFCVALYTLFGYGMYLGHGLNVYLPHETKHFPEERELPRIFLISKGNPIVSDGLELKGPFAAVGHRIHFLGQMWIGVAAWPAIWQYLNFDGSMEGLPLIGSFERTPR